MLFVVSADDKIDPAEVKILTRVYKLLDLDPENLFSDLHAVQTKRPDAPVTILQGNVETTGRSIPKPTVRSVPDQQTHVSLNIELIEKTLRETRQVQQLLASVFTEEETPRAFQPKPSPPQPATASIIGLDGTHSTLLTKLLKKPEWSRHELEALCNEHQVLPDGAIETINNVAIEKYGDLLFEMGDTLQLNHEIAVEVDAWVNP
jgi:hypothetical protein